MEDIRAAGFGVVYDPTWHNVRHAKIVAAERTFDPERREWLVVAFDAIARAGRR